jgi:hypothetical protein
LDQRFQFLEIGAFPHGQQAILVFDHVGSIDFAEQVLPLFEFLIDPDDQVCLRFSDHHRQIQDQFLKVDEE